MDFLSNGFQKLFKELEQDDLTEFTLNDHYETLSDDKTSMVNNNNSSYECDYYSYVDNRHDYIGLENILECCISPDTFNLNDLNMEKCLDFLIPTSSTNEENNFDWETCFLDNYVEIPKLTEFLPEKTALCNDSCELFLKESSDNLNKFRPSSDNEQKLNQISSSKKHLSENGNFTPQTFSCNYGTCSKIYAKPAHLRAHLRRHLGEKPYICTWPDCTWKFSRSDELARHRRSHSGIKPYKCNYCTKCFSRSDHLTKHRKVHERRMLAASRAKGFISPNILNVRPGRRPKNQQNPSYFQ